MYRNNLFISLNPQIMTTRVLQIFKLFWLFLERTTQGILLPIYNEIQTVVSDNMIFKEFTLYIII